QGQYGVAARAGDGSSGEARFRFRRSGRHYGACLSRRRDHGGFGHGLSCALEPRRRRFGKRTVSTTRQGLFWLLALVLFFLLLRLLSGMLLPFVAGFGIAYLL